MDYGLVAIRTFRYGGVMFEPGQEVNPILHNIPRPTWLRYLRCRLIDYGVIEGQAEESSEGATPDVSEIPPELVEIAGTGVSPRETPEEEEESGARPSKTNTKKRRTPPKTTKK